MKILPAIDIQNGRCVRLFQGNYDQDTIYQDSPVIMAQKWESQGAQMIHVVDLDGAREGQLVNIDTIKKIVNTISIPIQIGGGIRSLAAVNKLIKIGVSRVILGTALEDEELLDTIIGLYGEKIVVSLDIKNGLLMKNGWLEKTNKKLLSVMQELEGKGMQSIIFTDTMKDGTLTEPNYKMIKSIIKNTKMKLIIAGGISSKDQIMKLKKMNVDGVIIGKALYEGKIDLKEVINYVN